MNVNDSKQAIAFWVGCWTIVSAIAGCTNPNLQQHSEVITPTLASSPSVPSISGVESWTTILKGESARGVTFSRDGKLFDRYKVLLQEIPVSYVSDGKVIYAERLIVSEPSPSGRFNVVKACESRRDPGLCWAVFLVDRESETAQQVGIAKYGGQNWVQWSADERYAVFAESMEGVSWFVALDLQSKEAKMFAQTPAAADLSSFTWIDDRTFEAKVICGDRPGCTEAPFQGNISALFAQ